MPVDRRSRPDRRPRKRMARVDVAELDWKDVALLRAFLSDRGKMRPRRITGLTPREQRRVANAIKNAREMALLPYPDQQRPVRPESNRANRTNRSPEPVTDRGTSERPRPDRRS
jgi:small subunit ribosomal protein S18